MTDWKDCRGHKPKNRDVKIDVKCPVDGSTNVRKNGTRKQTFPPFGPYECKDCGRQFYSQEFKMNGVYD